MLKGKTAVVTGGSRGIGKAIALHFAAQGANVAILYAGNTAAAQTAEEELLALGVRAKAYQCDVSDFESCKTICKQITQELGPVDILVNNAGIVRDKLVPLMKEDDFDAVLATNLKGAFNMTKNLYSNFIRKKSGRIINISSVWGVCGASCEVHYSAAKAAVAGMTKALAKEVGPSGITVNCIAPGVIRTPMLESFSEEELEQLAQQTPMGRLGTGDDIAALAVFLASSQAGFVTGQVICADGGFALS